MTPTDFRETRERLGLTQAELAAVMGTSLRTITNIESGTSPKFELYALALKGLAADMVTRG